MEETISIEKRRSSCDECRARKLKCSGESPQCSRCQREGIRCVYSPQKPMGRPRKRRRGSEEEQSDVAQHSLHIQPSAQLPVETLPPLPAEVSYNEFDDGIETPQTFDPALIPQCQTNWHQDSCNLFAQNDLDFDSHSAVDPALWPIQNPTSMPTPPETSTAPFIPETPCTCLSIMYLALSDLQAMTAFSFPSVIPTQRKAMNAAFTMLHCPKCPTNMFSIIQNTQSLSTLLLAIAERFHRILMQIDSEAQDLERTGTKKPFRMGDNDPSVQHLHTWGPDCPLGFDIELDAKDWKQLAKKAIKGEVLSGGIAPTAFMDLVRQFEQRQNRWHADENHLKERIRFFGEGNVCRTGDAVCLRMINQVKVMVNNLPWE